MHTTRLLDALRKRGWLVIAIAMTTVLMAGGLSVTQKPLYQARATYAVKLDSSFNNDRSALDAVERLTRSQEVPATFVQIAQSRRVRELAASEAGLGSASEINVNLSARFLPGSTLLEIVALGDDPPVVEKMANASGAAVIRLTRDIFKVYLLEPLDPATLPAAPIRPNVPLYLALGVIAGLILGIFVFLVSVYLDPLQKSGAGRSDSVKESTG